jgi:hypothetical protein
VFQALIHRAQASVDKAIAQVANRAIIAIPFLIALGFATSAAYLRLDREFGAETATLIMAGGFAFIGLLAAAVLRTSSSAPAAPAAEASEAAESKTAQSEEPAFAAADKELMTALLTTAAPLVLPSVLRGVLRNLPLVAVILAAIFVLMSSGGTATGEQEPQEPPAG